MKNTWVIAFILFLGIGEISAQKSSLLDNLFGNDQQLIEKAIKNACFLIRQDYILKDSIGLEYKSPGKEYFGRGYGIGVVSGGKLWTTALSRSPWVSDVNFTPQKDKYKPENYQSALRPIDSASFESPQMWEASIVGKAAVGKFKRFEGAPQGDTLPSHGRLAVFYINEGEDIEKASIQTATAQINSIQWNADGLANEDQINLKGKKILGGALFSENIGYGTIGFELVGLYVKVEHLTDPWRIYKLPAPPQAVAKQASLAPKEDEKETQKKRKKKNKN